MKNLGQALRAWRTNRNLGLREAAKIIGTTHNTLSRLENGKPCDAKTLAAVLFWLLKGDAGLVVEAKVGGGEATLKKRERKK